MRRPVWIAALLGASVATQAAAQPILKTEPAMGNLKPGQRVLVDDGSCPKGQIKQVIGGDHLKAGGRSNIERQRVCITRK
jgi:hypothetical protein